MKTVNQVFGSVDQVYMTKLSLECFSLLPAFASAVAMPVTEVTRVHTGHRGRLITATSLASQVSISVWMWVPAVLLDALSVVSANN